MAPKGWGTKLAIFVVETFERGRIANRMQKPKPKDDLL